MKPISAIEPRKARLVPVIVAVFALSTLLQLASAGSAAVPEEKPTERLAIRCLTSGQKTSRRSSPSIHRRSNA